MTHDAANPCLGLSPHALAEFIEQGYEPVERRSKLVTSSGRPRPANTISVRLRHIACGTETSNGVTIDRARRAGFRVCETCHGAKGRAYVYTPDRMREILRHALNAQLVAPTQATVIFARKDSQHARARAPDDTEIATRMTVRCLNPRAGGVCGYERSLTVANALRGSGNGCPACQGNASDITKVRTRALTMGLTIENPKEYASVHSRLTFCCPSGHRFEKRWLDQRERGCPYCAASYGERLLRALCLHIWPDGDWQRLSVSGLDPEHSERVFIYDLASPRYCIAIENDSAYHGNDLDPDHFFYSNITPAQRKHFDALKSAAVNPGGELEGWTLLRVDLTQEQVAPVVASADAPAAAVHSLFLSQARDPQRITGRPFSIPDVEAPRAHDLFVNFGDRSEHVDRLRDLGVHAKLADNAAWLGRSKNTEYICTACSRHWHDKPARIERAAMKHGRIYPCPRCRAPRVRHWPQRVAQLKNIGLEALNTEPPAEHETVALRCRHHPDADPIRVQRAKLGTYLHDPDRHRPLCPVCAEERDAARHAPPADGSYDPRLQSFADALSKRGWILTETAWKGTSVSDGSVERYRIRCAGCGHEKDVGVHQALQKMAHGTYSCDNCKKVSKTHEVSKIAEQAGVTLLSNYESAHRKVHLRCDRADCPKGGHFTAIPTNLLKRGVQCKRCRPGKTRVADNT